MTGSFFQKKIVLLVALAAFFVGGFYPLNTANSARDLADTGNETLLGSDESASESLKNTFSSSTSNTTDTTNSDIYCLKAPFYISVSGCAAMGAYLFLGVASWVLWLSAILFNATINYTLNMAGFIKDIPIVALGWTTFRDVANLMFVFIVLYIAINTIVGNEGYGIKKLLGKVIVAAMLVNFSLFFTQAMIDVSNIFALQFYHRIVQDSADRSEGIGDLDAGISAAFVNGLGLQEVWGIGKATATSEGAESADINKNNKLGLNANNLIIVGIGGTILVLVTAFIFFAATFMFLIRAVTLIFLMILSPFAFMGSVLPEIGKHTSKWWSQLFNNLLFAPIYMALLYLVIHMITKGGFKGVAGGGSFYQLFGGDTNMIGAAMTFFVLNSMMVGCLLIASSFGVKGSKWAESVGVGFAKDVGMRFSGANLAMGAGRFGMNTVSGAGRGLAGKIGDNISGSKFLARMTLSNKPGLGRLAAYTMQQGDKLKDNKIGGKSFNEQVKEEQKNYTKRGNLIEQALSQTPDLPSNATALEKALHNTNKSVNKKFGERAEAGYLSKGRLSYASKAAIKKASKAAKGTDNKEALQELINGKFSPQAHKEASDQLTVINKQLENVHHEISTTKNKDQAALLSLKLSSLTQQKNDLNTIIKGHLDTVGKLSNLDK